MVFEAATATANVEKVDPPGASRRRPARGDRSRPLLPRHAAWPFEWQHLHPGASSPPIAFDESLDVWRAFRTPPPEGPAGIQRAHNPAPGGASPEANPRTPTQGSDLLWADISISVGTDRRLGLSTHGSPGHRCGDWVDGLRADSPSHLHRHHQCPL